MKKRIVCAILSLILLVSLIPAGALTASAASNKVSERAITVLKQLQGYKSQCSTKGYWGYGTKCTEKGAHGSHKISEKNADAALRKELETIDKAVNSFASSNSLSLSQSRHDALVLFSYRNGTAWMSGTGDVKRAVTTKVSGNEFLNMFVNWQSGDDNNRRLIEANMYLNGVYSTTVPSRYIQVTFDANGGVLPGNQKTFYYDYTISETELPTPTRDGYVFKGWYNSKPTDGAPNPNNWVHKLSNICDGLTLYAYWQPGSADESGSFDGNVTELKTTISSDILATNVLYVEPFGTALNDEKSDDGKKTVSGTLTVNGKYTDENTGLTWYRLAKAERYYVTKNGDTTTYKDSNKVKNLWVKTGLSSAGYTLPSSMLATSRTYDAPNGKSRDDKVSGNLRVISEFVDSKGVKWCKIDLAEEYTYTDKKDKSHVLKGEDLTAKGEKLTDYVTGEIWVKTGVSISGGGTGASGLSMDVTVTVTNSYVNARSYESIYAPKTGSYTQGTKLRIIDTADADGFLWGQVAKSADDATPVAWIALMYTNYSDIVNKDASNSSSTGTVIAKAVINLSGNAYVNVRSGAGTDNQIVGSLTGNTMVDIYEIKYVNGHQWGRCKQGWFLLAYADVTRLVDESKTDETSQIGFTSYAFTGKIYDTQWIFNSPSESSGQVDLTKLSEKLQKIKSGDSVTVTNITADAAGNTWGKISQGWIMMFREDGSASNFNMDAAKFEVVADTASVREGANTGATRLDTLSKGTEFDVTKIQATADTIWGFSDKVGDGANRTYSGWVNLSSRYVKRTNAPLVSDEKEPTGLVATVINVDEVNVRKSPSIYGTYVCKLTMGTTCEVLDGPENGWYRLKISGREDQETWVYQQYLDVKSGSAGSSGSTGSNGNIETGKGIVANTYAGVNMRQTAGIGGAFMLKILPGTAVEVLEVTQVGASKWGKVQVNGKTGWVCMDYITMISYEDIPGYNGGSSSGSTGGSGSTGSNTVTGTQTAIYTGKVGASAVNSSIDEFSEKGDVTEDGRNAETQQVIVFKTTDINGAVVRELSNGDPVTVHEILTVEEERTVEEGTSGEYDGDNMGGQESTTTKKTTYWARINDGYIRAPGNNIILDPLDEATYTVVDYDKVYVYEEWDLTENVRVEVDDDDFEGIENLYLKKGEKVTVTNVAIVGNVIAGMVENEMGYDGWVNLSKLTKGSINVQVNNNTNNNNSNSSNNNNNNTNTNTPVIGDTGNTGSTGVANNTSGYKYTGKVINTNEVNVRSTASTGATKTAVLKSGASLVIYETTISEGMAWGRCDAGWVYLYYVDLTPAGGSAIDARVVYNDNTIIYTDSACSETAGTYARMSVIDIYEVVGKMARTDKGWVNTDNLL